MFFDVEKKLEFFEIALQSLPQGKIQLFFLDLLNQYKYKLGFFLQKAGPKPTAQLDRTNDNVYHATTCVVRSVMALSRSVQQQQSTHYLENVKAVGFELRKLLEAVDQLVPALPISTHREVSSNLCRMVPEHEQWIKLSKKVK